MDNERRAANEPSELIRAIATQRDRRAFAELFAFYAPRVKSMMMRMGAGNEAAEDIAQEALLTIWRKADYFDPARATAGAWIYAIARNLQIDRLRRDQRAKLHELYEAIEPEGPERPDMIVDGCEREEFVRAALKQLSHEQIRVVHLSFFEGKAHGDIAEELGIPLGTVKSRLRLAMNRLRQTLGDLA